MPPEVIPWVLSILAFVVVFVLIVGGGSIWTGLPPRKRRSSDDR